MKNKNNYISKAWLTTQEGRFFLKDLRSKEYTDKEMCDRYGFNNWQVKRVRHNEGIYQKKRRGPNKPKEITAAGNLTIGGTSDPKLEWDNAAGILTVKGATTIGSGDLAGVTAAVALKKTQTVCIELSLEEMEYLREAAENNCRSISNQAKWILRNTLTNRF